MHTDLSNLGKFYVENYFKEHKGAEKSKFERVDDVMNGILCKILDDYDRSFEGCSAAEKVFYELLTADFAGLVELTKYACALADDEVMNEQGQ